VPQRTNAIGQCMTTVVSKGCPNARFCWIGLCVPSRTRRGSSACVYTLIDPVIQDRRDGRSAAHARRGSSKSHRPQKPNKVCALDRVSFDWTHADGSIDSSIQIFGHVVGWALSSAPGVRSNAKRLSRLAPNAPPPPPGGGPSDRPSKSPEASQSARATSARAHTQEGMHARMHAMQGNGRFGVRFLHSGQ
jgi:hypothetical protein